MTKCANHAVKCARQNKSIAIQCRAHGGMCATELRSQHAWICHHVDENISRLLSLLNFCHVPALWSACLGGTAVYCCNSLIALALLGTAVAIDRHA